MSIAAVVTLLTGVCAALLMAFSAMPAQAYPAGACNVSVSPAVVTSGKTLVVSGSASTSRHWKVSWNGITQDRSGTTFSVDFTAPKVTKSTVLKVHVNGTVPGAGMAAACSRTMNVTVRPAGSVTSPAGTNGTNGAGVNDTGGDLPNTGGPSLLWPLLGLALLLVGGTAAVVGSRRGNEAASDTVQPPPS